MAKKKIAPTPMSNRMKLRLNIGVVLILLAFLLYVVANLVKLSVVKADEMKEFAAKQQMSTLDINANRGTIYDANMEVLAQSSTVWTVIISPYHIKAEEKETVATELSNLLGVDYEKVLSLTQQTNQYAIVKKNLTKPEADQVRKLIAEKEYTFITLQEDTKRYYPKETMASQVIGFTNADNEGQYGLEQQYNDVLSGVPGRILTAVDARGDVVPTSYEKQYDPQDGNSLKLTLDSTIQHFAEKAINELVAVHNPKGGACAIVMDVKTGAILAMANYPTFDLNNRSKIYSQLYLDELANPTKLTHDASGKAVYQPVEMTPEELKAYENELVARQYTNKSISWLYEPGSVFKIVTASAALETGVQTMNSQFNCLGSINIAGTNYNCHKKAGHGVLDFTGMVANSCNPAFINMGQLLGIENFCRFVDMFGITEQTGIDLYGEAPKSIYYSKEKMSIVDLASESFGQSLAITPIQVITATAAAVNGGYLVKPYLVDEVIDQNGNIIEKTQPDIKRQIISEETSANINTTLEAMVQGSTIDLKGYRIGGKSGTSQIGNRKDGRYASSFVGVAPINDPQIAVLVAVDEPRGSEYYGNAVAGPALASILEDTLTHLGTSPEYTEDDISSMEELVPNLLNQDIATAQTELANRGLVSIIKGNGQTVVDQMPKSGVSVADGSKVILYTEAVTETEMVPVPNVLGMSLANANLTLTNAQLNVSLDSGNVSDGEMGTILVNGQSISEGVNVPIGTTISLTYAKEIIDLAE